MASVSGKHSGKQTLINWGKLGNRTFTKKIGLKNTNISAGDTGSRKWRDNNGDDSMVRT